MYPLIYHRSLNPEKWAKYSKGQQILMIANEINRAKNWIAKKQAAETNLAYERAFELIDLTVEDKKWKGRNRELLRFREIISELYCNSNKDEQLNNQCLNGLIFLNTESYNLMNGK